MLLLLSLVSGCYVLSLRLHRPRCPCSFVDRCPLSRIEVGFGAESAYVGVTWCSAVALKYQLSVPPKFSDVRCTSIEVSLLPPGRVAVQNGPLSARVTSLYLYVVLLKPLVTTCYNLEDQKEENQPKARQRNKHTDHFVLSTVSQKK